MVDNDPSKETMLMRRLLMAMTVLGMTAGTLVFAAGAADAAPTPDPCFVAPDNDANFQRTTEDGYRGRGTFWSDDELLVVTDNSSNGKRTVVRFSLCAGGEWQPYTSYDSGPNEGDLDREDHDLNIGEGRRIRFHVCERVAPGDLNDCGSEVYGHA